MGWMGWVSEVQWHRNGIKKLGDAGLWVAVTGTIVTLIGDSWRRRKQRNGPRLWEGKAAHGLTPFYSPFPPLWYHLGLRQVGMDGHASARVCRTKLYCRTLPYSLHSIGRIMYGRSPSAFFARLGRLRPYLYLFFLFPLLSFPFPFPKALPMGGRGDKIGRKNNNNANGLVDPCRCIFPRRGSCRGESLFNAPGGRGKDWVDVIGFSQGKMS